MDPDVELFDLCDERGRLLGRTKPRPLVHRDGDWHRSFHCWVVSPSAGGEPCLILQRRSPQKDTWPGLWDVSVAGHYSAGEGLEGGIREIREELGLDVVPAELLQVGWRREEVFYEDGLIEREVQDIFFLQRAIDLAALRPDPEEVIGVALLPASALDRLAGGRLGRVRAAGGRVDSGGLIVLEAVELRPEILVPRTGRYYSKVARFAADLARGGAVVRRRRWW